MPMDDHIIIFGQNLGLADPPFSEGFSASSTTSILGNMGFNSSMMRWLLPADLVKAPTCTSPYQADLWCQAMLSCFGPMVSTRRQLLVACCFRLRYLCQDVVGRYARYGNPKQSLPPKRISPTWNPEMNKSIRFHEHFLGK